MASCIMPTMNARVIAIDIYSALPGMAMALSDENMTIDAAVVGPDTRCHEDPNKAAIIAGIMLVYRPYSGGIPAIAAKATPCGKTIAAPVKPAIKSTWTVSLVRFFPHRKKGNNRVN